MNTTCPNGGREGGQTLLIFVLALTVLLGFTTMAIDLGLFFQDRRHLQNTADAAALAGVAELPKKPAAAKSKAAEWAVGDRPR
jgi:Flp pilus assembly protein TadG